MKKNLKVKQDFYKYHKEQHWLSTMVYDVNFLFMLIKNLSSEQRNRKIGRFSVSGASKCAKSSQYFFQSYINNLNLILECFYSMVQCTNHGSLYSATTKTK